MIAHFVVCTLGSADLVAVCVASIEKFGGDAQLHLIQLPDSAYLNPLAHGRALDQWRNAIEDRAIPISDHDVVVIMDPDCAILSPQWRPVMEKAFANDPHLGVWGAGSREDFGPRVHPSMMVIRASLFVRLTSSFQPRGEGDWRDTGGWYCKCVVAGGWRVTPVERAHGWDWHGASAWYDPWVKLSLRTLWDHGIAPMPLWSHLGGGTHTDVSRLTWWQRQARRPAIRRRRRWVAEVEKVLSLTPP
jgi:hypothetical protein